MSMGSNRRSAARPELNLSWRSISESQTLSYSYYKLMAAIPYFKLNDGTRIPSVGMGCWMGGAGGGERVLFVSTFVQLGYRSFDTVSYTNIPEVVVLIEHSRRRPLDTATNEAEVGRAIRDSCISRADIYLTTKLGNVDHHRVRAAFEDSLKKLGVDYVDLYLLHWPQAVLNGGQVLSPEEQPTFVETWKEMEGLLKTGKVKTIGVSNFSIKTLEELLPHCAVLPALNQVELHPCLPQTQLKAYCEDKGILLAAYSPFGRSTTFMEDATIIGLADKLEVSAAQVVISWAVQRGTVVIPKSENKERMTKNITLISLSEDEMAVVDGLHRKQGMNRSLLAFDGKKDGTVFGWTYEQLGWNLVVGGAVVGSE
ncbi:Aldo/keto reductase [Mycena rebaudengoi]|nr:Aldo/keto reductase [Mycena rebaudengoi]